MPTTPALGLRRHFAVASAALCLLFSLPLAAQTALPTHDNLNAALWMQNSAEFKSSAMTAFALARIRLDQALADKKWTGAPSEQKAPYEELPPALIVDVDETVLDNSPYQAWMVMNDKTFSQETWAKFCHTQTSLPIAGAVEFLKYADSKGVKIFYVSNRTADLEVSSRKNMERFGFPMGGNVDTFLFAREQPDWGSAKSTRRAFIAKDYRVLLNLGDNLGDFTDAYRGTEAERQKVVEENKDRWGREWIMIANPSYGSWESAPFGHDFKKAPEEQRKAKREALKPWDGN